jgi:galactose mutarotase-like enzyme
MAESTGGDMIQLENEHLRVEVLTERGAEIQSIQTPDGQNVLASYDWRTPLPASRSATYSDATADWLSEYRGGWQELFPNAGAACQVDGVHLPFHGEVSTAQWEVVALSATQTVLEVPARLPLILRREMTLDAERPVLRIAETVTNDSDRAVPFIWGHHPAFLTSPGAHLDIPADSIYTDAGLNQAHHDLEPGAAGHWPRAALRAGGETSLDVVPDSICERLVYLEDLHQGWIAIRDVESSSGVALAWDTAAFPHAWLWQQLHGPDFPWYGRAAITAIEPHSAWPASGLEAHIDRGTAELLMPGAQRSAWLTLVLFEATEQPVCGVGREGIIRFKE